MKFKLFTHNDLDGYGCSILALLSFTEVDIVNCSYNNIDDKVLEFIESEECEKYHGVFITDISVGENVAEMIDNINKNKDTLTSFKLIDHHKTALWLNKYSWCNVVVEDERGLCCGTSLFNDLLANFCIHPINIVQSAFRNKLVEMIRRYDTWEWKNKFNDTIPNNLNMLFNILGGDSFVDTMLEKHENYSLDVISETDWKILKIEEDRINRYIDSINKKVIKTNAILNNENYTFGVVFAENHISVLGNRLCELNQDLDFIAIIIGMSTVSLRTTRDDIDVSEIAKHFNGGGHIKASGFKIDSSLKTHIINNVFEISEQHDKI